MAVFAHQPVPVTKSSTPDPMVAKPDLVPLTSGGQGRSSKDAAADWLKAAEAEVKSSDAHSQAVYAAAVSWPQDEVKTGMHCGGNIRFLGTIIGELVAQVHLTVNKTSEDECSCLCMA